MWFHAIPVGQTAADFRTQTYQGRPVLTFWQGTGLGGLASGTDYIYDDRYQQIATVNAGNGLSADGHEFHINAVHIDSDGNLLIDARNTWTAYKVNRFTGQIIWQLGGKASSFSLRAAPGQSLDNAGEIFTWQHDPEAVGHDEYTLFDNESAGTPEFSSARAVTVRLDQRSHVATLVASDDQPEGLMAPSQGNAQTTRNGDLFVGWGALPYFSEFDPFGHLLFNA